MKEDRTAHTDAHTVGETVMERVNTFKFLGGHIREDLAWSHNTSNKDVRAASVLSEKTKWNFGMSTKIFILLFAPAASQSGLEAAPLRSTRLFSKWLELFRPSQQPPTHHGRTLKNTRSVHNIIMNRTNPNTACFQSYHEVGAIVVCTISTRTRWIRNSFYPQFFCSHQHKYGAGPKSLHSDT